jgi:crossover junction endodeoxyribonuclease RuvC
MASEITRVLGIDPGLHITGYALVDLREGALEPQLLEAGVIRLHAKHSLERRLAQLATDLTQILEESKPTCLAVEKLYSHYAHPRTAILMAHARGVILLAAEQRNLPVEHLPATAVKKAVSGHGHASKEQMQRAVQAQCRLTELPSPPDVADAIAIALTYGRRLAVAKW